MNVDMCEVAVDPETGLVEILDYVVAHDFGKVIRPSSALGQIENAITMNSGRALREELIWDEATGVLLNGNMYDYKVPTILDQPKIEPVPVETRCGGGAYGSTGVAHATRTPASWARPSRTPPAETSSTWFLHARQGAGRAREDRSVEEDHL